MYVSISCSQHGRTAVLLSAAGGHLDLMRELVEQHRADLHHKSKVSSAPSVCDSECDSHLSRLLVVSVAHIIQLIYTHAYLHVKEVFLLDWWRNCIAYISLLSLHITLSLFII